MFLNLKMFTEVVKSGNMMKTAERYHMNQSTLGAQIRKLEETIGLKLFDRVGRHIHPNAIGLRFNEFCCTVLDEYEKFEREVSRAEPQYESLSICAGMYFNEYFLPQILPAFQKEVGQFMKMQFLTGYSDAIIREMKEEASYDLAIVASSHPIRDARIMTHFSYTLPVLPILSPENKLAKKDALRPDDLKEQTVIMIPQGENMHEYLTYKLKKFHIRFAAEVNLNSIDAIKSAVEKNVGIGFMPEHAVRDELAAGRLVHVPIEDLKLSRRIMCISHVEHPPSMAALDFVEIARSVFDKEEHYKKNAD